MLQDYLCACLHENSGANSKVNTLSSLSGYTVGCCNLSNYFMLTFWLQRHTYMSNYSHWNRAALTRALLLFADFMQSAGAQAELFFWLTVEGYRVTAQQQLEAMQGWQKDGKKQPSATKGLLKAAALGVYEQYLSDKVGDSSTPRFCVICHNLVRFINKTPPPSGGCWTAQHKSVCSSP